VLESFLLDSCISVFVSDSKKSTIQSTWSSNYRKEKSEGKNESARLLSSDSVCRVCCFVLFNRYWGIVTVLGLPRVNRPQTTWGGRIYTRDTMHTEENARE